MKMRLNICGLLRESDLGATATHTHSHTTHTYSGGKKNEKDWFGCSRSFNEKEVHALPPGSGYIYKEKKTKKQAY